MNQGFETMTSMMMMGALATDKAAADVDDHE